MYLDKTGRLTYAFSTNKLKAHGKSISFFVATTAARDAFGYLSVNCSIQKPHPLGQPNPTNPPLIPTIAPPGDTGA